MKTIYLDNASATPVRDEVLTAMIPCFQGVYGNPSSLHHKGREAKEVLDIARHDVARALGAHADEIIFTGGGTEANNLALQGIMKNVRHRKSHILVSAIEHPSILETAETLKKEGFEVEHIPVDTYGLVSVEDVLSRARMDTALISIMYANNEVGTVAPIAELARALSTRFGTGRPLLHTDACQAPGQLPLSVDKLGVDLMTLNGSKMYGPKGVGALFVRNGVYLTPLFMGGEQEHSLRAGTENLAGVVGFARALRLAVEEEEVEAVRLSTLRDYCISEIQKAIPNATLNGHPTLRLPNNIHFSFPHIEGESLILLLDMEGICASTGSACSAHDLTPSHVLRALGADTTLLHGSLRLSLGRYTKKEDIDTLISILTASITKLRAISPLPLHL